MLYFKDRGEGPYKKEPYQYKYGDIYNDLRKKYRFYQLPSSRLIVDEIIIRFIGRSLGITVISIKLVLVRLKFFDIGDKGYIQDFGATKPSLNEGQEDEDITLRRVPIPNINLFTNLSNTQAVIERLVSKLYPRVIETNRYYLYLDNLFMNQKLCYLLKSKGIIVTGTVRKGAYSYLPYLSSLKIVNYTLKQGSLQNEIIEGVLAFFQQNLNSV